MARRRFSADITAFARRCDASIEQVVAYCVFAVGSSLVMKSPVGNPSLWKSPPPPGYVGGRFRASWQYATGSIPVPSEFSPDASGGQALSRIAAGVSGGKAAGQVHYIVNALPYGRKLEYGWSSQAPAGMVGITVMEFRKYVSEGARRVK